MSKMTLASDDERFTRTSTISVRLEPRVRYLLELAAREQQRTLSNFIEWAIYRALTPAAMEEEINATVYRKLPLWYEGLWDVDDADRFYLLALHRPGLLTDDEQRLWKRIVEDMSLYKSDGQFDRKRLRSKWERICASEDSK
jgi:hypothetical protein